MGRLEEIAREKEKLIEEISRIDAKVERILKDDTLVLSKEDQIKYEKIKKEGFMKIDTANKYLAFKVSISAPRYALKELEREECGIKGHPGEKVLMYSDESRALCQCSNCGKAYNRPLTSKEYMMLRDINSTPMTI